MLRYFVLVMSFMEILRTDWQRNTEASAEFGSFVHIVDPFQQREGWTPLWSLSKSKYLLC
jgi:hypothetical protein